MNIRRLVTWAVVATLGTNACSDRDPPAAPDGALLPSYASEGSPVARYLVVFAAERVPADFGARIARLDGTIEASLDSIGVAAVSGLTETAAVELMAAEDVRAVEPDPIIDMRDNIEVSDAEAASETAVQADATAAPTAAQFYARQWNLRAVLADQAWAAGNLGSGDVKVAIVDTGIDYLLPDFAGLVDLEHSTSLIPEDVTRHYPGRLPFSDLYGHGTAVTSIVGSNARTLAAVNQKVTLLAVKIADSTFSTSLGLMLSGIVYAADQGADVINISNGVTVDKHANPGVMAAVARATTYAFRKGAVVVAGGPGNDAADLDHNGDLARVPCEGPNVICVSATGPTGALGVNGPWVNVDASAPYTSFGRSAISVAAPGGTGAPGQFRRVWVLCTSTPTATTALPACQRRETLAQGQGVSFAAPHVAGLAALLVAQLGHGKPALIRARILESADDLGEPGTDPYYGKGRINIARALGVLP